MGRPAEDGGRVVNGGQKNHKPCVGCGRKVGGATMVCPVCRAKLPARLAHSLPSDVRHVDKRMAKLAVKAATEYLRETG